MFNAEKGMKDRPSYYQKISCASLLVQLWGPKPLFLTIFGQKVDWRNFTWIVRKILYLHFTFTVYSLPLTFEDYWLGWSAKQKN